uniref:Prostamide/prostaglandin F synthase n=1 Tax=Patiria miniata TaxID=46514 RepID=A0A914A044_PATMI
MDSAGMLTKIAGNLVKSASSGEMVAVGSFWKTQTCVIHFMRRFGCPLCRLGARELSTLKPQLDAHNIRLIGIGLEEFGLQEFVEGKFWDGELYVDLKKQTYAAIGYKRFSYWNILAAVFSKKAREALNKSKAQGITGNMKGDGLGTGGVLIVSEGGKQVLLDFKQSSPGDHVQLVDVLKALGIDEPVPSLESPKKAEENKSDAAEGGKL